MFGVCFDVLWVAVLLLPAGAVWKYRRPLSLSHAHTPHIHQKTPTHITMCVVVTVALYFAYHAQRRLEGHVGVISDNECVSIQ